MGLSVPPPRLRMEVGGFGVALDVDGGRQVTEMKDMTLRIAVPIL